MLNTVITDITCFNCIELSAQNIFHDSGPLNTFVSVSYMLGFYYPIIL